MKHITSILLGALISATAFAQAPVPAALPATFIKGSIDIRYSTRTQLDGDKPREGVEDVYTLNVNISNIAGLRGTIAALPYVKNTFGNQRGKLTFNLETDVYNPKNVAQTKTVGKITGTVPVDDKNVYSFAEGTAKMSVFPMGRAEAFESTFKGTALGKPPTSSGMFEKLAARVKERINVTKSVGGKQVTIAVTNYDQMILQAHTLPAGPARACTESTVSGTFMFDYERNSWYLQGVTVTYVGDNGRVQSDTLTGNIRWLKASNEYEFDIRVNEPVGGTGDAFASASTTEDFFAVDNTLAALTGKMTYKDTESGGKVVASSVIVDLKGNQLTNYQVLYLGKLLFLTLTGPLNAD